MKIKKFNIRVYGILINKKKQILVCEEYIKGNRVIKLPGGGLEFGEGTIDCLKREFIEEINTEVDVLEHFYTTDYFQQSAFRPKHQLISIYYIVKPKKAVNLKHAEDDIDFRWIDASKINENDFTLPVDKIVGKMLKQYFKKG